MVQYFPGVYFSTSLGNLDANFLWQKMLNVPLPLCSSLKGNLSLGDCLDSRLGRKAAGLSETLITSGPPEPKELDLLGNQRIWRDFSPLVDSLLEPQPTVD